MNVEAKCQSTGTATNNYTLGSINNLLTPLSYISSVENITVSSGGCDDEEADKNFLLLNENRSEKKASEKKPLSRPGRRTKGLTLTVNNSVRFSFS